MGQIADTVVKLDVMGHVIMLMDRVLVFKDTLVTDVKTVRQFQHLFFFSLYLIYSTNIIL